MGEGSEKRDSPTPSATRWDPNPKQRIALSCPVTEVFYGGGKGSGKTDFLLMDFPEGLRYGNKYHGILFRRTYGELEEIIERANVLYPRIGGSYMKTEKTWRFGSGSTLKLRYLDIDQDVTAYQGHQYCVAVGTLIEMADGLPRPIEKIRRGEWVRTLEGPRRVIDRVRPYKALCVKAKTRYGSQVHPIWHPILTEIGWQSFASLLGIGSRGFVGSRQEFRRLSSVTVTVVQQVPSGPVYRSSVSPKIFRSQRKSSQQWSEKAGAISRFSSDQQQPPVPSESHRGDSVSLFFADDSGRVRCYPGIPAGLPIGYRQHSRSRDELLHDPTETSPNGIPSQGDAATPFREHCRLDAQGSIPRYTPACVGRYEHPYTGQVRTVSEETSFGPCEISPFGKAEVCDITVEGANHYISHNTRLVNCNTWIGFDELTSWSNDFCYIFMFSCLRSPDGIACRVRGSGNPGMPGHLWVKSRFIDVAPPGVVYKDPVTGQSRVFIPALLDDNPYLLHTAYESHLLNLPEHLYKAFRHGDWNVVVGQVFSEYRRSAHVVKPFALEPSWFRFASMDWGYAKPFSIGWWAITHDGRMIRYREWYGCQRNKPNEGLRLEATKVAEESLSRGITEGCKDIVLDRSCWNRQGTGMSVAEIFDRAGWHTHPSNSDRMNGLAAVHDRLQTIGHDAQPMMIVFDGCLDWIRTVPVLAADSRKPEDVDTTAEDHAYDDCRYACLSDFARRRVTRENRSAYKEMQRAAPYSPLEWKGFDPFK